jgi:hypothetical protein
LEGKKSAAKKPNWPNELEGGGRVLATVGEGIRKEGRIIMIEECLWEKKCEIPEGVSFSTSSVPELFFWPYLNKE